MNLLPINIEIQKMRNNLRFIFFLVLILSFGCTIPKHGLYKMKKFGESKYADCWTPEMLDSIGMSQITKLDKKFFFRYGQQGEAVDIWSDDMISFHGKMFCFTSNLDSKKKRYFGMVFNMPDSIANKIGHKFQDIRIDQIPVHDSITAVRCNDMADGFGFCYEYKIQNNYSQKIYCYFEGIDSIKSYQKIVSFNEFIYAKTEIDDKFKIFMSYLPPGNYWSYNIVQFLIPKRY